MYIFILYYIDKLDRLYVHICAWEPIPLLHHLSMETYFGTGLYYMYTCGTYRSLTRWLLTHCRYSIEFTIGKNNNYFGQNNFFSPYIKGSLAARKVNDFWNFFLRVVKLKSKLNIHYTFFIEASTMWKINKNIHYILCVLNFLAF